MKNKESEIRQKPIALNDLYPKINAERIGELSNNPTLKAREALLNLNTKLEQIVSRGNTDVDILKCSSLLDQLYPEAMETFNKNLLQEGYTSGEVAIASNVLQGKIKIK